MDGIFVLLLYIYRIDLLPAMKISIVEELLEAFPDVRDLLIDGTERPIRRSKDDEKQKELTDDAKVERMILAVYEAGPEAAIPAKIVNACS
ncbi:hypothetical protein C5S42_02180 [Candidatus Methanomarinus sp.]|nr:hypothetical protein C5S42_02180 [ANME-2 cluster archaeon]